MRTQQLNGPNAVSSDCSQNQIEAWDALRLFSGEIPNVENLPRLVSLEDTDESIESRVRSYWDSNCSMCHGTLDGIKAEWDARYFTPLKSQGVIDVEPTNGAGQEGDSIVAAGDPDSSFMFRRLESTDPNLMMPPFGRSTSDEEFTQLLRQWIEGLE